MATAGISGQPQGMPWGATGQWYATFAVRHGQSGQQQSIVEAAFRAALRLPPIQGPVADDGRLPMIARKERHWMLANILPFVNEPYRVVMCRMETVMRHCMWPYDVPKGEAIPLSFMYQPGRGHGLCLTDESFLSTYYQLDPNVSLGVDETYWLGELPRADENRILNQALKTLRRTYDNDMRLTTLGDVLHLLTILTMPENHGRDFGNSTNLDRLATQLDPEVRRRDVPVVDINNLADHLTNMSRGGGQGMVNVRLGDGNVVPVARSTMTIAEE